MGLPPGSFQLPLVEVVEDGVAGQECFLKNVFGNLPLSISKVGWILAYNPNRLILIKY